MTKSISGLERRAGRAAMMSAPFGMESRTTDLRIITKYLCLSPLLQSRGQVRHKIRCSIWSEDGRQVAEMSRPACFDELVPWSIGYSIAILKLGVSGIAEARRTIDIDREYQQKWPPVRLVRVFGIDCADNW